MSRIGKKPVQVPAGVEAALDGRNLSVKGPKGSLSMTFMDEVNVKIEDGAVSIRPV